jgi:Zn-dependent peptidase ImmA (M78 family)
MNTTTKGDILEHAIFDYFTKQVAENRLPWSSNFCKVFRKKGYYSRDREADIKFDVSIEFYLPGVDEYSMVWLIECKNYSNSVSVDNVEEFLSKVQQVASANSKAIMVSNSAFASGGMNIARNRKMGIIRYFDPSDVKWELYRSPSATMRMTEKGGNVSVIHGLTSQDFKSSPFDLYMQGPDGQTNSLWDFAAGMLSESTLTENQLKSMRSPNTPPVRIVPYISQDELENRSLAVLRDCGYQNGAVSLDDICAIEGKRCGLKVAYNRRKIDAADHPSKLGQISFSSLEILIYEQATPNIGRERFTLAHELAHHLLAHGTYMSGESCDEYDFALLQDAQALGPDVIRMEYQANIFASCLLMPHTGFIGNFRQITNWLDIPNRGFGELYLDNQTCNYVEYERVTGELMKFYGVSRAAVSIRLQSLGLLHDVRAESGKYLG